MLAPLALLHTDVVLDSVHRQGWALLRVPPDVALALRQLETQWRAFFAQPAALKDAFRTPTLTPGYMTPFPGLHETFEYASRAPSLRCPPSTAALTQRLFEWLEATALAVLRAMLEQCCHTPATWAWSDALFPAESTLRLLHYDRVEPTVPVATLEKHFPAHTDSSLITLAPRSSMAALEMKRFDTGDWVCVEEAMDDGQIVVFMGDAGAYLTNNHFPSPIHRPGVGRMLESWRPGVAARISTPFFLRAAPTVVLDPAPFAAPTASAPPPLSVAALSSNSGGCRDQMPWKLRLSYYQAMEYSQ